MHTIRGGGCSFNIQTILSSLSCNDSLLLMTNLQTKISHEDLKYLRFNTALRARLCVTKMQLQRPWEGLQKVFAPWSGPQRREEWCHLQLVRAQRQRWQGHAKPPATIGNSSATTERPHKQWRQRISKCSVRTLSLPPIRWPYRKGNKYKCKYSAPVRLKENPAHVFHGKNTPSDNNQRSSCSDPTG